MTERESPMARLLRSGAGRASILVGVLALHAGTVWALLPGHVPEPTAPRAEERVLETMLIDDTPAINTPAPAAEPEPPAPEPPSPEPRTAEPAPPEPPPPSDALASAPRPPKPKPAPTRPKPPLKAAEPNPAMPSTPATSNTDSRGPAPTAPEPATAPAPAEAVRAPAVVSCRTPAYPPGSRRAGETGTVGLRLLIDAAGAVIDRQIERSSGFPRLDEAALAALGACRFQPATADGRHEPTWVRLRYVWTLT